MSHGTLTLPVPTLAGPAATPRYKHDCDYCKFLGHVDVHQQLGRDVYLCGADQEAEALILRDGDLPWENSSFPAALVDRAPAAFGFAYELAGFLVFGHRQGRF